MGWIIKKLLFLIIIVGIGYFVYARFFMMPPGGHGMMGMMGGPAPVSVAEVIERDVQQWQEFAGRIIPVDSAEIRPQVSGLIDKIHFKEGEYIEKGAPLFTIDQRPYKAALDAAQAQYTLADSELQRAKMLLEAKAISQREFDQRRNASEVARANLTKAKLDYDYTLIRSPISGRVGRAEITVGNLVSDGGSAPVLTTIVADKPVYADFEIDEDAFLEYMLAVGSDSEKLKSVPVYLGLSSEDGEPHVGLVQSFDNQLNMSTGTIRVRTIFDNESGNLVPGLFARIRLGSAGESRVILITDRAIGTDQNKKFVLAVDAENKAEYREITIGGIVEGLRVVTSGLKAGDKIVVNGTQRARPGAPLAPEMVPMDAPPESLDKTAQQQSEQPAEAP